MSCCQDGLRKINDNDTGIQLMGDNLDLRGPLEMRGNRFFALRMFRQRRLSFLERPRSR